VDREEALRRLAAARVGRLATADASGRPHVVPLVFAVDGDDTILWAVDHKPKRSRELRRLANIAANPRVELVVDRYDEDWTALWWVRAAGTARIVEGAEVERAKDLLGAKYPQYRDRPPAGPFVAIAIERLTGWTGGPTA
jgi:PPOX class probable F420-dependent enzyme